jgi:hypothetical protein
LFQRVDGRGTPHAAGRAYNIAGDPVFEGPSPVYLAVEDVAVAHAARRDADPRLAGTGLRKRDPLRAQAASRTCE